MSRYMLLHRRPDTNAALPPEVMTDLVRRYYAWAESMRQKGKLHGGEKLAGRGGYFVVEARDDAEADAIAGDCPHLWNPSNWIEVRPIDLMTAEEAPGRVRAVG